MLKSVVIKGLSQAQSRSLTLPFRDAVTTGSPIFANKVSGFGPVKADVNMDAYPEMDEEYLQSTRVGGRTIQIQLSLRPRRNLGETVQSLRRSLYKVVPPKTPVRITINDDEMVQTYVDGVVEGLEPTIFEKNTDLVLTIRSASAYLASTTIVKNQTYRLNTLNAVNYAGDAQTPIAVDMTLARTTGSIAFQVNGTTLLQASASFSAGDKVSLITTPRAKVFQRTRGSSKTSLLDSITAGSLDIFFDAATDTMKVITDVGAAGTSDTYLLSYTPKYVGV